MVELVEARWRTGAFGPYDLQREAGALLDAGVSSDSLVELYALDRDVAPWRGPELLDRALVELGGGAMTEAQAVEILLRHFAQELSASKAAASAVELNRRTGLRYYERLSGFAALDDEAESIGRDGVSYLGRTLEEIDADIRALFAERSSRPRRG